MFIQAKVITLSAKITSMTTSEQKLFPGTTFISTILDAADIKASMSRNFSSVYLMRAGMAGFLIGIFYLANFSVISAFVQAGPDLVGVGRLAGAIVFGFALVFIYYTKSELLTSNMMITTIAVYYHKLKLGRGTLVMMLCFLGNFLGGLIIATLMHFSTLLAGPTGELVQAAVDHKLEYVTSGASGMLDLFVRAILCNFMINIAMLLIYNGFVHNDGVKVIAMVVSVVLFAFLGFEHSVANTVLFTVEALQHGIPIFPAIGNIAIALVGNFVGGGLLIGWYYAYANDAGFHLRRHPTIK